MDDDGDDALRMRHRVYERVYGREPEPVVIGPHRVLLELSRDSSGTIYAAYDNDRDRKIAVLLRRRGPTGGGSPDAETILREANKLLAPSETTVVRILQTGRWHRRDFVVLEFGHPVRRRRGWIVVGALLVVVMVAFVGVLG